MRGLELVEPPLEEADADRSSSVHAKRAADPAMATKKAFQPQTVHPRKRRVRMTNGGACISAARTPDSRRVRCVGTRFW
jgi:hypothetical protein